MANQLTPNAKQKFSDANGDPLAGGKLYTYVAGTVNPATTYVSLNGAANANPIILNANGECDLWLTDGNSYKFELKNSVDVTQWTVDNIATSSAEADTVSTKTSTYTAATSDDIILAETASAWTLSLFTAVGNSGKSLTIKKTSSDTNELTIDPSGAETIDGFSTIKLKYKNDSVRIVCDGANWLIDYQRKSPTIQSMTTGSGTYTAPNGVKRLFVRAVGGGGGGGGSASGGSPTGGGNGSTTTFGTSLVTCGGGSGGNVGTGAGGGQFGAGGTASIASPAVGIAIGGSDGGSGSNQVTVLAAGGNGGCSFFGGAGAGGTPGALSPGSGKANSGSGGGGAGSGASASSAGGGGAGGFVEAIIQNPSTSYSFSVGSGGSAGAPGSGTGGASGAGGRIDVIEEY